MEARELTDRYRLEKILGSSAATTVFAATEAASGRPVVVKLVHPRSAGGQDVARSRFAHWATTVRGLAHPALPAVVDAGFTADGDAFLVTERLAGRPFGADLSPRAAAGYLDAVGEALALLAKRGLAHGNLSAENLWVEKEQVKLLGLGSAVFRGTAAGEGAAAADASALAALRDLYAPAAALAEEPEPAGSALEQEKLEELGEEEVLSPVSEELLHAPPEPPPALEAAAPMEEAAPVSAERSPKRPGPLGLGLAVAAALVLALGAFLTFAREDPPPVRVAAAPRPAPPAPRVPGPADLLPAPDAAHVREWAAARFEGRAEERARAGDYAAALAALATLERQWPERAGLDDRLAALRAQRDAEPVQQALLDDTLPGFERRRKPAEGLAELARVEPTPHLAPAFAAARGRLEAQLAALDREPPVAELREGYSLDYARGTVAELSFRVRDDYEVERVRILARRPGGSFRELPHTRSAFAYTVEIGPDFHGNGTVELYVVATDLSGNEGGLGSRERPLLLRRQEGFERLIGN